MPGPFSELVKPVPKARQNSHGFLCNKTWTELHLEKML